MRCTQCASRMARCFQMKMQKRSYLLFFFSLFLFYTSLSPSLLLLKRSKLWLMTLVFVSLATRTYVVHV